MEEELFYNKYRKEECIGRGASAEVWRVTDMQTGVTQALKIYDPALAREEDGLDLMRHEFALMANINHQNLLRPLFFDIWDSTNTPFLVLPYCKNGNLSKKKGDFSDKDTWELLRDVASGLAYLHKQDPPIIHQDIKPENILINDDGSYMLTDFGVSAHAKATMHRTISAKLTDVGTMAYMAPEKFAKDKKLIILSDIWSLGAMAYEMVSGEVPFCIGQMEGGVLQLKGAELPELPETVSPELREIIYKCLELDPWDRPQASEIEATARIALGEERISILPGTLTGTIGGAMSGTQGMPGENLRGTQVMQGGNLRGTQVMSGGRNMTPGGQTVPPGGQNLGGQNIPVGEQYPPQGGGNVPPASWEKPKSKTPWAIIAAVAGVFVVAAVAAALFFLLPKDETTTEEPVSESPTTETTDPVMNIDKIEGMLREPSTALEGWQHLCNGVEQKNADATYLMGRLRLKYDVNEKSLDIIKIQNTLRQCGAQGFYIDNDEALNLLEESTRLNPKHYKAFYELGCYYLSQAINEGNFDKWNPKAWDCFEKSEKWVVDEVFRKLIEDKIESLKGWHDDYERRMQNK